MAQEPFVMRDVARAQEWVSACSKSCRFPADQTAEILASLCGFGSWDVMVFGITSLKPSACDEHVGPQQTELRIGHYAAVLIGDYGLPRPLAVAIIANMSPSSSKQFMAFELSEVMEPLDDEDSDQLEFDIDEAFAARLSPDRLAVMAPLSAEVSAVPWLEVMNFLGWEAEDFDNDEELMGEPSFFIYDARKPLAEVPVYLSHGLPAPAFTGDLSDNPSIRLLQFACMGNFMSEWAPQGSTDFLILASRPQIIINKGKWYCHIGVAYDYAGGVWTDLLINRKCRDVGTMLRLNRKITSLAKGATPLSEADPSFIKLLTLILDGFNPEFEDPVDWTIIGMPSEDGWFVVGAVEDGSFDEEELEPYRLEGF